jgi:peptidoglycan-binding protein CsiV
LLKPIKYIALLPCFLLLPSTTAFAAKSSVKERWFEVEVILFTQLGDKSVLKEQFPEISTFTDTKLQKKIRTKRVIELLKPFLKPDISSLKTLLTECGQQAKNTTFFQQAAQLEPFYQEKTLKQIAAIADEQPYFDDSYLDTHANNSVNNNTDSYNQNNDELNSFNQGSYNQNSYGQEDNKPNDGFNEFEALTEQTLAPETIALVTQAEQQFSPYQFNLSTDYLPQKNLSKRKKKYSQLCRLPEKVITQLAQLDDAFSADDFTLEKVPSVINGAENRYNKRPYLLSKSSLKLNDVAKQLRWSKNFKPLLHIGWRQAPKGRNSAIPLHIFAGDNLQADYQKRLAQYHQELKQAQLQELSLAQVMQKIPPKQEPTQQQLPEQAQYQQAFNTRLDKILTTLANFTINNEDIIAQLDSENLPLKLEKQSNEQALTFKKPQPPLQEWFLDGYFKVNLNHYLYITADFTLLNKTLAQQASDELKVDQSIIEPLKLIEFKQNRRVISKEIHYFDHPYMGMIVQIRRHKRPAPVIDN